MKVTTQEWNIHGQGWEAAGFSSPAHAVNEDALAAILGPEGQLRFLVLDEATSKQGIRPSEASLLVRRSLLSASLLKLNPALALVRTNELLERVLRIRNASAGVCAVIADIHMDGGQRWEVEFAGLGDCTAAIYSPKRWWHAWRTAFRRVLDYHLDEMGQLVACLGKMHVAQNSHRCRLREGDILVLASDGAFDPRADSWAWVERILGEPTELAVKTKQIIESARESGSHDDATIVLVRHHAETTPLRNWYETWRDRLAPSRVHRRTSCPDTAV